MATSKKSVKKSAPVAAPVQQKPRAPRKRKDAPVAIQKDGRVIIFGNFVTTENG